MNDCWLVIWPSGPSGGMDAPVPGDILIIAAGVLTVARDRVVVLVVVACRVAVLTEVGAVVVLARAAVLLFKASRSARESIRSSISPNPSSVTE